ncbi:MAG: hypothetical protein Ct9H90mP6_12200 [Gammaproteobacteria bacterium]|nr:MAG: hypothetical protein Ct9H90mP6_12200 [Gammaproteobacteria bacterium]
MRLPNSCFNLLTILKTEKVSSEVFVQLTSDGIKGLFVFSSSISHFIFLPQTFGHIAQINQDNL